MSGQFQCLTHRRVLWFLAVCAALTVLGGCTLPSLFPLAAGPYLTATSSTSATIAWIGSDAGSLNVAYWPADTTSEALVVAASAANEQWSTYHAEITGLSPSTRYAYRLERSGARRIQIGPTYEFVSAPTDWSEGFSFNVVSDLQDHSILRRVVADMVGDGDTAFWMAAGDITHKPTTDVWRGFFSITQPYISRVPFRAAYGNHDSDSESLQRYMGFPEDRRWYSFNYGSAHVIALDSKSDFSPGSAQYQWLVNDLTAASGMPWRFAFFHHPQDCPTEGKWSVDVRQHLNPLFEQYGVQLVFNGHSHVYEHYLVNGVHYVLAGGGRRKHAYP